MPQYLAPGVYVEEVPSAVQPIAGVGTSTAGFIGVVPNQVTVPVPNPDYDPTAPRTATNSPALTGTAQRFTVAAAGDVLLCTNYSEFTRAFGGFSTDTGQRNLAHAVYGFFNNGGTRCFVTRVAQSGDIGTVALPAFAARDEIALVAAPGITTATARSAIVDHCRASEDRFAILDMDEQAETGGVLDLQRLDPDAETTIVPPNSDYAAVYWPWVQVYDPATGVQDPDATGYQYVPPSGHMAGIYARVDTLRGVHKAPANEVVRGALGLRYMLSRAAQGGLNPRGINAIRELNGNIRVWGARTLGGDQNGEWKYVNVRRLFLFLRESIDEGTQWVVFEPNDSTLWAKISRNVTAFLTNVWRNGALLGSTPEEAFFVKCDAETNPPEVRDQGMVIAVIGVAVVRPAEFVIFRISQMAPTA
jgi:uncharacterized protein